jgi:hypothetical protein
MAAWGLFAIVAGIALWLSFGHASVGSRVEDERFWDDAGALVLLRRLPCWSRPTALALLFALLSWPLVALTLGAIDTSGGVAFNPNLALPATALGQWSAAASAVFLSALVGGTIGAPAVRRHAKMGGLFTFVIALLVATPALPLVPALLGQNVGAGCSSVLMSTAGPCSYYVATTNNLFYGLWSDAFFYFAPLVEPVPVLILAVGVGIWTAMVRRLPAR